MYAYVSESAQWTMTSWADHLSGAGRHFSASSGTCSHAVRRVSMPRSYSAMRGVRSSAVSRPGMSGNLLASFGDQGFDDANRLVDPAFGHDDVVGAESALRNDGDAGRGEPLRE